MTIRSQHAIELIKTADESYARIARQCGLSRARVAELGLREEIRQYEASQRTKDLALSVSDRRVAYLPLSTRTRNCLKRAGIIRVSDLLASSMAGLLKLQNFGRKSLNEVIAFLAEHGLTIEVLPEPLPKPKRESCPMCGGIGYVTCAASD